MTHPNTTNLDRFPIHIRSIIMMCYILPKFLILRDGGSITLDILV